VAERQDNHGRDPQYVRVLNVNGDGFVDLGDLATTSLNENDPKAPGSPGFLMFAVRRDSLTIGEDADGDLSPITVDKFGRVALAPAYLTQTVNIANAGSLSPEVDTTGRSLAAIIMPSAWTAAVLTFQGSNASGGTFADVYDDQGNEVTVQAAASRAIGLDAVSLALAPYRYLKVRSGTGASPVAQGASRDMQVILKGY
jgi:hypothetical protein